MIVRMTMHHPDPFSARGQGRERHVSPAQIFNVSKPAIAPCARGGGVEGGRTFRLLDEILDPLCRLIELALGRIYLRVQLVQHSEVTRMRTRPVSAHLFRSIQPSTRGFNGLAKGLTRSARSLPSPSAWPDHQSSPAHLRGRQASSLAGRATSAALPPPSRLRRCLCSRRRVRPKALLLVRRRGTTLGLTV